MAAPHTISNIPHPFDPDWPDVQMILQKKCAACHRPKSKRADFSTYEALMSAKPDDMPVVVPGKPDESSLWEYVEWNVHAKADSDAPDSPMMPEEKEHWLTAGQLQIVRRWIENGAYQYCGPPTDQRPVLETDFPSAQQCRICHPKQFKEWSMSMHAYGQQSPIFEAFNLALIERTSGTLGTFCTRCHTNIGTALGENGSRRNVHRSQLSLEGVTCVTCHRRPLAQYKSSGRLTIQPGSPLEACFYGPFEDARSADIGAHQSRALPYLKSSQFCGECHDVTSPSGVRLEEAFSEWQTSPAAREGVTCQQCHMGPVQGVAIPDDHRPLGRAAEVPGVDPELLPLRRLSDHTFAGPDYSLLPDTEFPYKLDWMYEHDYRDMSRLTQYQQRTLTELRYRNREAKSVYMQKRFELLRNAARLTVSAPSMARVGETIDVRADITSIFNGHKFPSGFSAERQIWISIEVRDPLGNLVFVSGNLDSNGDLRDEHSHDVLTGKAPFDWQLLNLQNKFIGLAHKGTERSVVLSVNRDLRPLNIVRPAIGLAASFGRAEAFRIGKSSLPPHKSVGRTYHVQLPNQLGSYHIHAQLNVRHLPPTLLDHIGTPHLKHLLEVTVIDQHDLFINVCR